MNLLCLCSLKADDTYHLFMCYQNFSHQRTALFDDVKAINLDILKISESDVVRVSLFGSKGFTRDINPSF